MAKDIEPLQAEWIPELAEFLRTGFQAAEDATFAREESLYWKYFDPDGIDLAGRSLVARENGRIIGHIGFTPTAFVGGNLRQPLSSVHMMDWLAPARHAPMGAMLMLQAFRQSDSQFAVGGNEGGRQVSARAGYRNMGSVVSYRKILDPNFCLRSKTGSSVWRQPLRLAKAYAKVIMHPSTAPEVAIAAKRTERFGEEVDAVVNASRTAEIYTSRTAERLNHYLRHPLQQMSGWLFSESGTISGFALLNLMSSGGIRFGKIVDLFMSRPDTDLWHGALYHLAAELRNQDADLVECYAMTPWLVRALEGNGFFPYRHQDFAFRDPEKKIDADATFYLTQLEGDHGYL